MRQALFWSFAIHAVFLTIHPLRLPMHRHGSMHVSNVALVSAELPKPALKPLPQPVQVKRQPPVKRLSRPVKTVKPAQGAAASAPVQVQAPPPAHPPVLIRDAAPRTEAPPIVSEADFAAFQHRQRVRQYLKAHSNFPNVWVQGTVRLRLVLLPDGGLESVTVLESSDPRLERVAVEGATAASPYPHFLKAMKPEPIRYEFILQYKYDE